VTSVVRCLAAMLLVAVAFMPLRFAMAEPLHIYAAGSLTGAFTDMVKAFPAAEGDVATPVFGPSGVLREKIEHGDHVDVFASADMAQPRALARSHSGSSVVMFTRNRLRALGRASVGMTTDNLLDRLLDPSVRLATSTPGDRRVRAVHLRTVAPTAANPQNVDDATDRFPVAPRSHAAPARCNERFQHRPLPIAHPEFVGHRFAPVSQGA
jgi:hypothetical protein